MIHKPNVFLIIMVIALPSNGSIETVILILLWQINGLHFRLIDFTLFYWHLAVQDEGKSTRRRTFLQNQQSIVLNGMQLVIFVYTDRYVCIWSKQCRSQPIEKSVSQPVNQLTSQPAALCRFLFFAYRHDDSNFQPIDQISQFIILIICTKYLNFNWSELSIVM